MRTTAITHKNIGVDRPNTTRKLVIVIRSLIVGFHMTSLKFKLKKLSILPRSYFHDVLQQLKTNFHTNFCLKRVLGHVMR